MRFAALAGFLVLVIAATPAAAQFGGGGGIGGGTGSGAGRGAMGQRANGGQRMLTEEEIDGPPTPGMMQQLLSLEDGQTAAYQQAYDSLMRASQSERDSARVALKGMRDAFGGGDRETARANGMIARRIGEDLEKRDAAFDKSLRTMLNKDQQKRYDKWKAQNRKEAEEKQREEMRARMGADGGRGRGSSPRF